MRIAVINETSAADKNKDIIAALEGRGHQIINAGMTETGGEPEMTYIHTGLLSAMLLNLRKVDLVIGGCGTGQGYLNSVMQYPNCFCGLIQNPLDIWLFGQINGGNAISLVLNFGYGWAGDINLKFIFDRLFELPALGKGYPPHREESQQASRKILEEISVATHKSFADIITSLDDKVVKPVLDYPGVKELLDIDSIEDEKVKQTLLKYPCNA
ncbi:MAG: RpiB/LacA/LacB family sugar-phosphate isomerase [Bacteroidota bacterium]|nr:RpiB/LacA/LacB family sugar-phosphate isomerase [Bacteroidota bacterium]